MRTDRERLLMWRGRRRDLTRQNYLPNATQHAKSRVLLANQPASLIEIFADGNKCHYYKSMDIDYSLEFHYEFTLIGS